VRASGAGKTAIEGVQELGTVAGGAERLDRVMPDLVDQLKRGNASIQLQVR
jgi:hypothetical protein